MHVKYVKHLGIKVPLVLHRLHPVPGLNPERFVPECGWRGDPPASSQLRCGAKGQELGMFVLRCSYL